MVDVFWNPLRITCSAASCQKVNEHRYHWLLKGAGLGHASRAFIPPNCLFSPMVRAAPHMFGTGMDF